MPFYEVPVNYREYFGLFLLVLFLMTVAICVQSMNLRNRRVKLIAVFMVILAYGINQVVIDASFWINQKEDLYPSQAAARIPITIYGILAMMILIVDLVLLGNCFKWSQTSLTAMSIRESIDLLPSGLMIYDDRGRCLLLNQIMNQLSVEMNNHLVMNGKEFYQEIVDRDMVFHAFDRDYIFQQRSFAYEGETYYELQADDVTEFYTKHRELKEGNRQIAQMAEKMRSLTALMDDTVRKNEILKTKIRIHDEMNMLLLRTNHVAVGEAEDSERQAVMERWKNDAFLLSMQAETRDSYNVEADMNILADILGLKLILQGQLPENNRRVLKLFSSVTKEAMTNAAKHAEAREIQVEVQSREDSISNVKIWQFTYKNDGKAPRGPIRSGGGLDHLKALAAELDGSITTEYSPRFLLTVEIPE